MKVYVLLAEEFEKIEAITIIDLLNLMKNKKLKAKNSKVILKSASVLSKVIAYS